MQVMMIHSSLYRVHNNGKVKDVWIRNGEISEPRLLHDILTDEEKEAVEKKISK